MSDERRERDYRRVRAGVREEVKTKHDACDRAKRAMTHNMRGRDEKLKQKERRIQVGPKRQGKSGDSFKCEATWIHRRTMSLGEE